MESSDSLSTSDGLWLIDEETFDFDLPVSPQESTSSAPIGDSTAEEETVEDEDEVFIGPVGFKEKCVAANAEIAIAERKSMSPPTAEQYASLFKEAWSLAIELKQNSSKSGSSSSGGSSASDRKSEERDPNPASSLDSIQESSDSVESSVVQETDNANGEVPEKKSELQTFKRQVKRDMRSTTRRNTYTIATNQPSPYPSVVNESATGKEPQQKMGPHTKLLFPRPPQQAPPARGRGSMLSGLRRPAPVSVGRTLGACPEGAISKNGSANAATSSGIPTKGLQKPVKRLMSPKVSALRKPGFSNGNKALDTSTEIKPDKAPAARGGPIKKLSLIKPPSIGRPGQKTGVAAAAAAAAAGASTKPQPMKATLNFGGTNGGVPSSSTAGGVATRRSAIPSQIPANTGKRRLSTPKTPIYTPVVQEKKVVPKRLMSSGGAAPTTPCRGKVAPATPKRGIATPRRNSLASSVPRPSTPVQPSTPHTRHSSISIPPSSAGPASARRRSGIPTPNRRASTSTRPASRLAAPAAVNRPQSAQPAKREAAAAVGGAATSRFSPLLLSPLQTPPSFQLSPEGSTPPQEDPQTHPSPEGGQTAPLAALGSSPELLSLSTTKTPDLVSVLRTRTNLPETGKETSTVKGSTPKAAQSVGMLIDFGSATPKDKKLIDFGSATPKDKKIAKTQKIDQQAMKENLLIDF